MTAHKPKQVRVSLNDECQAMFAELAEKASDLPESQLMTLLVTAALRAVRERDYRIAIPFKLVVVEETEVLPSGRRR